MKFDQLCSIGHNIAASLASGIGLPIGLYLTDIFGEASHLSNGDLTVDFLKGSCVDGTPSPSLSRSLTLYADVLVDLCEKHGTSPSAFRKLTAQYSVDTRGKRRFLVTVEDFRG